MIPNCAPLHLKQHLHQNEWSFQVLDIQQSARHDILAILACSKKMLNIAQPPTNPKVRIEVARLPVQRIQVQRPRRPAPLCRAFPSWSSSAHLSSRAFPLGENAMSVVAQCGYMVRLWGGGRATIAKILRLAGRL